MDSYTEVFILSCFSVYKQRFQNEATVTFTLRVMVGIITLYDHLHPDGAFVKKAAIDVSVILIMQ